MCEEFIYWSFLYQIIISDFHFQPEWSDIITALIFGLSHFMKGFKGIINSLLFGLIMGYLFSVTGSLVVPIIIHILYDLKPIYISRIINRTSYTNDTGSQIMYKLYLQSPPGLNYDLNIVLKLPTGQILPLGSASDYGPGGLEQMQGSLSAGSTLYFLIRGQKSSDHSATALYNFSIAPY
ncbi:CPBP family intramembrane glutamic endopeptidase [Paenibacillus sp. GSMTC-2017]|uniref:CPBP family intramembrane glutamic endopeptidase n=1 Tax=Paenibacillus sp. GSMTC-2017 TaxID=2794350 RepID=UPI003FA712FB